MNFNTLHKQITLFIIVLLSIASPSVSAAKNGFDLSNSSINTKSIFSGGPPRDGIPSIDNPRFIDIKDVNFLKDDDIVIGLVRGNTARAYPTRILVWHEIVNDIISKDAVAVTYCPLCGTAMVFDRNVNGKLRSFGVSGLLYQSDVLMYDRETQSLWSQLAMKAVTGPENGNKLTWLPSEHLTFRAWKKKYPHGQVLSTDTGYQRNYKAQAYESYFASDSPMFPVPENRNDLPDKEWVIGIIINGKAKAYPVKALPSGKPVNDSIAGESLEILYDAQSKHTRVKDLQGKTIPSVSVFWFAWQAFYPGTGVWQP